MLSPKEFATLMLVKAAPDQIDMCREELDTLLERQLVALQELASGHHRLHITGAGHFMLNAVARKR